MYNAGQGQGQTYVAPEGNGFSAIVGTPKSDQAGLWIAQKKADKVEQEAAAKKLERQKALGMMDDIKADAFQPHFVELQNDLGKFYDKVANDMITLNNPFDLRDPRGAENMKKITQIKAKIALSKNMQNEFDMFERGEHKDIDPKSVEAKRQQFLKTPLQDWADGKVEPVKLVPKNPYDSQDAIFAKHIKDKSAQYQSKGLDLVDDPKALGEIVGDVLQNDEYAKGFYQKYFDALPKDKQKAYEDKALEYTKAGTPKTPFEAMALEHLQGTLPRTPVDYDKFLKDAVNVGDVVSEGGNQVGTWESKNSKKAIMPKIKDLAKSQLLADPKALKFVVEKFGIKETDPQKQLTAAVEQVSKDKYNTLDVKSGSKQYKLSEGEKGKEEMASSGQTWLNNLYSNDPRLEADAAGFVVGKNTIFGDNVKKADVIPLLNNISMVVEYDNDVDAARAAKVLTSQGISGLDDSEREKLGDAFKRKVAIPLNDANKQQLMGIHDGAVQARKKVYSPLTNTITPQMVKSQFELGGNATPVTTKSSKKTTSTKGKYSF